MGWAPLIRRLARSARGCRALSASCADQTTSQAADAALLLREYAPGRLPPQVVPCRLTADQAAEEFLHWQRRRRRVSLAPQGLLSPGTYRLEASMLPFWLFDVRARVEYRGEVGTDGGGGRMEWRSVGWRVLPPREYASHDPALQVYASYRYRRDFAETAKAGGRLAALLQPLLREAALQGAVEGPAEGGAQGALPLDPPTMRQAIAWELALHAIHQREVAAAEAALGEEAGAQLVRDVHVRITPLSRRACLVYAPAYVFDYIYGETFNVHGERKDEWFQAMVSGAARGVVAGERHLSAHKASLAAGTVAVGVMAATAAAAPLLGMDPWALMSLEGGFYAAATAWTAGLGARLVPLFMRQHEEEARVRAEEAEMERVVGMGLGPLDPGTREQEVLRSNAEWRRWGESDKQNWSEHKRRCWAEELWRGQQQRRLERVRVAERLQREAERQAEEAERERRRQQRWGNSSQQHHFRGNVFAGGHKAGGRHDFLGYYHLLGLTGRPQASVSAKDIKQAFRRLALKWHPDKHEGQDLDVAAKQQARQRFAELRAAYEVLNDPEKRRQYDNGQHVRP